MRASVRSTFETRSGSSETSSTTLASASAEVIDAKPNPRAPSARSGSASARPSALPASATSASAAPGSTSSARSNRAYSREPFEQPVEHRQPGLDARGAATAQLHANPTASRRRHDRRGGYRSARRRRWAVRPMSTIGAALRYSNRQMTWLGTLFAAVLLAPAQPLTIAVVDTGANVRVPEIAAKRPATYDIRHART